MSNKSERIPARILLQDKEGKPKWVTNISALTESELLNQGIVDFDESEDCVEEYNWISSMLKDAIENEMENEVVQWALKEMKDDPRLTPAMALRYGYLEWVK
jgi:hypothetical protein